MNTNEEIPDGMDVTIVPLWGHATITQVLFPSVPDEQQRQEILRRMRDVRLQEVDQLEIAMGTDPRTSEIRRQFKALKVRIKDLLERQKERENEK